MAFQIPFEASGEFIRGQLEYWRAVRESGGFDLEGISVPRGTVGLMPYVCDREDVRYPHSVLVNRYARLGLHRYNESYGTNLQLSHLNKFNMTMNCQSTYYITLTAYDPTGLLDNYQVGFAEGSRDKRCSLNLSCFMARRRGTPSEPVQLDDFGVVDDVQLPYWPSDFNDSQRFYQLNELDYPSWIRLYLELTLCANDRGIKESDLAPLQIVKVATETIEDDETIQSVFYIRFKGLAMARVGDLGLHVERKVIARRTIHKRTGCWTLHGGYGFSSGEAVEQRFISRPSLHNAPGTSIPYQGPITSPPLRGRFGRKMIELGLFRD